MAAIITDGDLTSYLRQADADVSFLVDLTNGIVSDVTGDLVTIPSRVMAIALEVAARAFRNPGGYSSETIDDYTYRRDAETRQAGVYLTSSEKADLLGAVTAPSASVYTIPLGGPDVWL